MDTGLHIVKNSLVIGWGVLGFFHSDDKLVTPSVHFYCLEFLP